MEKTSQQVCQEFHRNPSVNPRTGSKIQIGKGTYLQLVKECGEPRPQGIIPGFGQPAPPGFPGVTFGAQPRPAAQPMGTLPSALAGLFPTQPTLGQLPQAPSVRLPSSDSQLTPQLPGPVSSIPLPTTVPGLPTGPSQAPVPPVIAPSAISPAVSPATRPQPQPQFPLIPSFTVPQIQIMPSQIQSRPAGAVPAALIIVHSPDQDFLYVVPRDTGNDDMIEEAIQYATGALDVESDEYQDFEENLGVWSARDVGGVIRNANIDLVINIQTY